MRTRVGRWGVLDGMGAGEPVLASDLIDLTGIDLAGLDELPESVLKESLQRIRQEIAEPAEWYAGFESAI